MIVQNLFSDVLGFKFDDLISPSHVFISRNLVVISYTSGDLPGSSLFDFELRFFICASYEDDYSSMVDFTNDNALPGCENKIYFAEFTIILLYSGKFKSGRKKRFNNVPATINIVRENGIVDSSSISETFYTLANGCSPLSGTCAGSNTNIEYFELVPALENIINFSQSVTGSFSDNLLSLILDDESNPLISSLVLSDFDNQENCTCIDVPHLSVTTNHKVDCVGSLCDLISISTFFTKSFIECSEPGGDPPDPIDIGEDSCNSWALQIYMIGSNYVVTDGVVTEDTKTLYQVDRGPIYANCISSTFFEYTPLEQAAERIGQFYGRAASYGTSQAVIIDEYSESSGGTVVNTTNGIYNPITHPDYNVAQTSLTGARQDIFDEFVAGGFFDTSTPVNSTANSSNSESLTSTRVLNTSELTFLDGVSVQSISTFRTVTFYVRLRVNDEPATITESVRLVPGQPILPPQLGECQYCFSVTANLDVSFVFNRRVAGVLITTPTITLLSYNSGTVCINGPGGLDFATDFAVSTANQAIEVLIERGTIALSTAIGGPVGSIIFRFITPTFEINSVSTNC